ncbi:chemotaxis protein CheW [Palleronia abyssalis]|uniref:chemotaxis protein CheW n=1 Tax=Palleronia abyssalis TaxID=1501240 RepID=UPI000D562A4C|nr:chemotaxis protein CheW [Palleronia abyssalis]
MSNPLETSEIAQALTFSLEDETFAIPVGNVSEIIDPLPITAAPNANRSVPGLVNVRGAIAPVLDLRHRLGMMPGNISESSRMLILDFSVEGETTKVAILVDDVNDITESTQHDLESIPQLGAKWPAELIKGAFRIDGNIAILLDVNAALAPELPGI